MPTLLSDVEAGDEVEITRHGRTVARLVPAGVAYALKDSLAGLAISVVPDRGLFSIGQYFGS